MVNIEPHIEVYDVQSISSTAYGNAGKIALVGAFPTSTFKLDLFTNLDDAMNALKGEYKLPNDNNVENASREEVPATYISFYCLEYIFKNKFENSNGAESVVIYNTNYGKSTLATSSTNAEIATALIQLAEEDFDILTIAEPIQLKKDNALNPVCQTLKSFVNTQYLNQKPFGIITGFDLTDATEAILIAFKALFKDKGIFKAVTTPARINGDENSLNIAQSGCWHSAFTAGRPVNKSETAKIYDELIGENSKDLYPKPNEVNWEVLLNNGFHTTKYKNRRLNTVQCLSNITPCDYDMKIERVKNYLIKRLTLADALGDDNIRPTREYLKGLFEYEKNIAIQNNYIVDMDYNLVSVDSQTVKAELSLYIPDIIRVIILNVNLNISAYTEEA